MGYLWLCAGAFVAGLIDSVAGGGGLIQLPALFLFLPQALGGAVAPVFGTNKLSSICGTGMAVVQYARRVPIPWRTVLPAATVACGFAGLGAHAVSRISPAVVRPLAFVLLVAVALYTYARKDLGATHAPRLTARGERLWGVLLGAAIGFYDGFFGPGTGTFLMFAFVGKFGFDFLRATACAKVLNVATNLAAVAYFAATDSIYYRYAVPMAACNVAGAMVGTRLAILRGNAFVRRLFLSVIALVLARFGWQILGLATPGAR